MVKEAETVASRKFGIDLVGAIPWGTHLCQFYESKQDLIDILVPYFAEGLRSNEFCMWVTSPPLEVEDAKIALGKAVPDLDEYLHKGQIEIISYNDWYLLGGKFDASRVLPGWVEKETNALKRGFVGLRLTGNTLWVERDLWKSFVDYEEALNAVIGKHKMIALCTYCLDNCSGKDILDVVLNHVGTLIKQGAKWSQVEDVIERKKAEDELRTSERRLNRSQEIAHLGSWELDLTTNKLSWSDEVYRIFGLKPQEFGATYEAFLEALHPDDRAAVDATYSGSLREGRDTYEIEHRVVRKSTGEIRVVQEKCEHIRDGSGKIIRSVGMVQDTTERKNVEQALQKAKFDWERTFDSVPDLIAILDNKHRIVRVNKAMAQKLEMTPEQCVGLNCYTCVHGTDNPLVFCPHTQTLKDGMEHVAEIQEDRLGGYFLVSTTPLKDEQGNMVGSVHVARNITEHKKADEMVRSSLERLRSFVEVTGQIGWTTNGKGEVVEDIPSFRKFTGQTYEEVRDWGWSKALHPDDVELTKRIWKEATKTRKRYEAEYRLRRHDGIYRHFLARGVPVFNEDATVREWVGTCIDITERKELEKELIDSLDAAHRRQSEVSALLRASKAVLQHREFKKSARIIFDSCKELLGATAGYVALLSKDGKENEVLFLDSGGLPCTVNPSLPMPIRGLRAEAYNEGNVVYSNDFAQSKWMKLMPKGHVQLSNVMFVPLISGSKTVGVIGLANKLGGFIAHDSNIALAFGEIASVALINSRVLETLEELVEERTKELKNSERLAAIGETAGMVGHDLRNPLQTVTGETYLAKSELKQLPESETKARLEESVNIIAEQISYMDKIVSDLQDFVRPISPDKKPVNLPKLLNATVAEVSIPENIEVHTKINQDLPELAADGQLLKRVFINLLTNAVQAMPEGGKLTVKTQKKKTAKENGKILISVEDTGAGIPENIKPKIFRPLFTTKSRGQGFGLAVCKRVIEAHGGAITFQSQEGRGSQFTVELPT